jgi:hypothetical protein
MRTVTPGWVIPSIGRTSGSPRCRGPWLALVRRLSAIPLIAEHAVPPGGPRIAREGAGC